MEFDTAKLSKEEYRKYMELDPGEQRVYRELWIRQQQALNRAKMEYNRQKTADRKARTHRLIVRGAILEQTIPETQQMDDETFSEMLRYARETPYVRKYLQEHAKDD